MLTRRSASASPVSRTVLSGTVWYPFASLRTETGYARLYHMVMTTYGTFRGALAFVTTGNEVRTVVTTTTTTTTLPDPKVAICHESDDEGAPKTKTIRVSRSALSAHLAHGDSLGACL